MNKLLEHLLNDDLISFTEEVKSTLNEKAKEELKKAKPKAYTDDWAPSVTKDTFWYHMNKAVINPKTYNKENKVRGADHIASHMFFTRTPKKD